MPQTIPSIGTSCCDPTCCEDAAAFAVDDGRGVVEKSPERVKQLVKEQYTEIARKAGTAKQKSCCGPTRCGDEVVFADDYSKLEGYVPEADLGVRVKFVWE